MSKNAYLDSLDRMRDDALFYRAEHSPGPGAFDVWFHETGHWVYENREDALAAWEQGLAP